MSFIDSIRNKFSQNRDDGYYDDQDYDEDYYDDYNDEDSSSSKDVDSTQQRTGLLGNSRRPEPESVSVYTRSGRPLGSASSASTPQPRSSYDTRRQEGQYQRPVTSRRSREDYEEMRESREPAADSESRPARDVPFGSSGAPTPGDIGGRAIPRASSGKLPPYVLKPAAYDDVQMVVRRVRTNQPVVLVFRNTNIEAAKRILDFSFGLAMGVGGQVQDLGDRVFVVLPAVVVLTESDINKLVADGDLLR